MELVPGAANTSPVVRAQGQLEAIDDFLGRLLWETLGMQTAVQRLEHAIPHRRFASAHYATEMDGTCIQSKHLSPTYFGANALNVNALQVRATPPQTLSASRTCRRGQPASDWEQPVGLRPGPEVIQSDTQHPACTDGQQ